MLILSDIHDEIKNLREVARRETYDLVIVAGDFTYYGSLRLVEELLDEINDVPIVYVPGNTDPPELINDVDVENTYNVHGRVLNLMGITFVGVGGSLPTPFRDTIRFREEEYEAILRGLEPTGEGPVVFVSHTPPHMVLDKVYAGFNVGSKAIREYITRTWPTISVHGHIHEARGIEKLGRTIAVNPGPLMRCYYAVVDFPNNVELKSC